MSTDIGNDSPFKSPRNICGRAQDAERRSIDSCHESLYWLFSGIEKITDTQRTTDHLTKRITWR